VTGVVALRSKWAAGKAVRAGLAVRKEHIYPFGALSLAQGGKTEPIITTIPSFPSPPQSLLDRYQAIQVATVAP